MKNKKGAKMKATNKYLKILKKMNHKKKTENMI